MLRRIIQIIIFIVLVFIGMMISRKFVNSKKAQDKTAEKPVSYVRTLVVENNDIPAIITVTGRLTAKEKISIISEVTGTLKDNGKLFKEGVSYNAGETLLSIEAGEFRMNLLAQKSAFLNLLTQMMPDLKMDYPQSAAKWNEFIKNFQIEKPLNTLPEADGQEKYFLSSRNVFQQYYAIKSLEERLAKYTITAPFYGTVSISNVYPGMTIPQGQLLGEFLNPNAYEIEAALNSSDLKLISVGNEVELTSAESSTVLKGKLIRISDKIDPATQSVKIFIAVQSNTLREGMYVTGKIQTGTFENVFELPRKLLLEGEKVFAVADTVLAEKKVEVIRINLNTAIVRGLENGTVLMDETISGAYTGMPVRKKRNSNKTLNCNAENNHLFYYLPHCRKYLDGSAHAVWRGCIFQPKKQFFSAV